MFVAEQQKEKLEQIENCQLSLIALSEKDACIECFKLGVKMTTEKTQIHSSGDDTFVVPAVRTYLGILPMPNDKRILSKPSGRQQIMRSCRKDSPA